MNDPSENLFQRLGGPEALVRFVEELYARVLDDPELKSFFENASIDRVHRMQYQFLASAFDGPVNYSGSDLRRIHSGRGIKAKHFAKFCSHFADVLESGGVDARDIDDALGRLALSKDSITGESNVGE